jgi:hypothetical protein
MKRIHLSPPCLDGREKEFLHQADAFDFYHLPEYHQLAEERGEGKGVLFVYQESSRLIAWPFLLRSVATVQGLEDFGAKAQDATSVYGYPGPLFNTEAREDTSCIWRFGKALDGLAREMGLVTLFSRMHPLLQNALHELGIGAPVLKGETVSIDLRDGVEQQWQKFRKSHRYEIRRAELRGIIALHDREWERLDEFIHLYLSTMQLVGAAHYYFFDRNYFLRLREALGNRLQFFVATFV